MRLFHHVVTGRTQAAGVFTVQLGSMDHLCRHQVQVEVSATPSGGTLTVAVRAPGATQFVPLVDSFDLTGTELLKTFGPLFAAALQFTPSNFDAGKTFNVIVNSGMNG